MKNELLAELDALPMDFVMSVGPACRPAQQIKAAGLRFTAAPMDWMQLYPLDTVTHIFATGFQDFFAEIEEEPTIGKKKRRVWDRKNTICSIHHFPADQSMAAAQKEVRKTMLRRYRRIHRYLQSARRICFVCNREDSPDALLAFLEDFRRLYPGATLVMVNMRHTDADGLRITRHATGGCTLYEAAFRDVHPDGSDVMQNADAWHGNTPCWQEVLGHVHLSDATKKKSGSKLRKLFKLYE